MLNQIPPRFRRWPKQPKQPPYRQSKPEHAPRDRYDQLSIIISFIGLIVLIIYTLVTGYQAYLTRRALSVAVVQQRAWIKLTTKPISAFGIDGQHGAMMIVGIAAANVGTLPAVDAQANAKIIILPPDIVQHWGIFEKWGVLRYVSNICVKRGRYDDGGQTIFPNETITLDDEGAEAPRRWIEAFSQKPRFIGVMLAECITYKTGTDGTFHHTIATYYIRDKRRPHHWNSFDADLAFVPLDQIQLERTNVLNQAN